MKGKMKGKGRKVQGERGGGCEVGNEGRGDEK